VEFLSSSPVFGLHTTFHSGSGLNPNDFVQVGL
jgi:hypothetical protein